MRARNGVHTAAGETQNRHARTCPTANNNEGRRRPRADHCGDARACDAGWDGRTYVVSLYEPRSGPDAASHGGGGAVPAALWGADGGPCADIMWWGCPDEPWGTCGYGGGCWGGGPPCIGRGFDSYGDCGGWAW